MLICVDVGNTTILVGVYEEGILTSTFRLETKVNRTEDEYGIRISEGIRYHTNKTNALSGVIIASVVPTLDETLEKAFLKYFNQKPLFVGPGVKTGIAIKIDHPRQLGSDLIAGAVAAVSKYGAPIIVIDMGTAITLSLINEKKEFLGGIIYPGVNTAYNSLIKNTSLLEAAQIKVPSSIIGRDTISSMQSGMIYGTVGAINGMLERIFNDYGKMKVVFTGGAAHHFMEFFPHYIYDVNLVLEGLRLIYERNK